MKTGLLSGTRQYIHSFLHIEGDEKILVAVSGGPDSMALLYTLHLLGYKTAVAHCNFSLRPEANAEEELVREFASSLGIDFFCRKFDTEAESKSRGESIQVTARELRYEWFEEVRNERHFSWCATGHNLEDNSETLLQNLIKGKSAHVLKGIPPVRGRIIRPILWASRELILEFLKEHGITFAMDASNLSPSYDRNKIRLNVLPHFKEINPSFAHQMQERLDVYTEQISLLKKVLRGMKGNWIRENENEIQIELQEASDAIGKNGMKTFLELFLEEYFPTASDRKSILSLVDAGVGKLGILKNGIAVRERKGISIVPHQEIQPEFSFHLKQLEENEISGLFGNHTFSVRISEAPSTKALKAQLSGHYYLDLDKIKFPVRIRNWKSGDKMIPLGMSGYKKLSDIFVDEKYSNKGKMEALVFEDEEQILCLSRFRISENMKVTSHTKMVLEIVIAERE